MKNKKGFSKSQPPLTLIDIHLPGCSSSSSSSSLNQENNSKFKKYERLRRKRSYRSASKLDLIRKNHNLNPRNISATIIRSGGDLKSYLLLDNSNQITNQKNSSDSLVIDTSKEFLVVNDLKEDRGDSSCLSNAYKDIISRVLKIGKALK